MQEDDAILAELGTRFPVLQGKMRIQRDRRVFVEVPDASFADVFAYLYGPMKFMMMTAITGMDQGANLAAMYHLARESGVVLNLLNAVPKNKPVLQTVTPYFPAAECYERELIDLLGMVVEGLPEGSRYPLPEGWPEGQYPLRKEWNAKMLDGATASTMPGNASFFAEPKQSQNLEPSKEPKHA